MVEIKCELDFSWFITTYKDLWEKWLEMCDDCQEIAEEVIRELFRRGFVNTAPDPKADSPLRTSEL